MFTTSIIPATKSHGVRTVAFLRNFDLSQANPQDGTLTVTELTGIRVQRLITERYLIQEQSAIGFMGRAFLVVKDDSKGDDETQRGQKAIGRMGNVYDCCLHADGLNRCTCDAGAAKKYSCVHALALRALIDSGGLEPAEGMHPIGSLIQATEPVELPVMDEPQWTPDDEYACEDIYVDPVAESARLKAKFEERRRKQFVAAGYDPDDETF